VQPLTHARLDILRGTHLQQQQQQYMTQ
jgi:hypothetical protein